jgi:hypothetical protein
MCLHTYISALDVASSKLSGKREKEKFHCCVFSPIRGREKGYKPIYKSPILQGWRRRKVDG